MPEPLVAVFVGALIGIITWPTSSLPARIGIDASWIVGLHMAARQGMSFGSDILFTYGPLGFLGFPQPYVAWTSGLALAFVGSVHVAACSSLFYLARQKLGGGVAFVLVTATAFTFPWVAGWPLYGLLIFIAGVAAVLRRHDAPSGDVLATGLGVAVGFAGLGKLNIAVVSLAVAAIAVVVSARYRRRSVLFFGVSSLFAFAGGWLITGQHPFDVIPYVRGAFDVSAGYSAAMGQVDPQTSWVSGVAALATVMLGALVWQRSTDLPRRDKFVVFVLFGIIAFASYKAGFTRAGVGMAIYLVSLLALWPVVIPRLAAVQFTTLYAAGLIAAFLAVSAMPVSSLVDPVGRMQALANETTTALTTRREAAASTAASLRSQYALPPEAIALLAGHTVDVQPWEAALAYAYPEVRWRPQPVFQAYSAYTPSLDEANARLLRGDLAPERILWLAPPPATLSIDGRDPWFDAPTAKIEMLCRYMPLATASTWQILGRVADRCSAAVPVGTVTTKAGDAISVPANLPPGVLTMRVTGVASDLLSRIVTLAYKAPPWWLHRGDSADRMTLGTTGEAAAIAATTDIGYRDFLGLDKPPKTVVIRPEEGAPGEGSPLTVEFGVIPISAAR